MENVDAGSYAEKDVSNLIMQVAKTNNMEISDAFDEVKANSDPNVVNEMIKKENSVMKN